jgi:pyridoxal phosphate enzyme (YggS family)
MITREQEIAENIQDIMDEIKSAAEICNRNVDSIKLVAVTKIMPATDIIHAINGGLTAIGENYIQEAESKFAELEFPDYPGKAPVERHFIGHLQSNKVKMALKLFDIIQTVDSLELAKRIDRIAGEMGIKAKALAQINISKEISKSGIFPEDVEGFFSEAQKLHNMEFNGLMIIGRFEENPDAARSEFIALRNIRDNLEKSNIYSQCLSQLSMGMSHDFRVAIEEGSTIVRVGSRIFGARNTKLSQ